MKKKPGEPASELGQNVRRLGAEQVFRHAATERCAQALAFRPLHQNDEDHEQRDERVGPEKKIDQNGHGDGQYRQSGRFVNVLSS
jgi:hypothetical protein